MELLRLINLPDVTSSSLSKAVLKSPTLTSKVISLANRTRRDLTTPPITDLKKAVIRIGRLGCADAIVRLERASMLESANEEWKTVAESLENMCDAVSQMARRKSLETSSSNVTDTVFLSMLLCSGLFIQVYAASELGYKATSENRAMVLQLDKDVTLLTLQALKLPADIVSRVNMAEYNPDDIEGQIATDVWKNVSNMIVF
nr:HDOD domain-containing protein [Aliidiomarina quisquiliarum]